MPGGITFLAYADDLRQLLDHLELPTATMCGVTEVVASHWSPLLRIRSGSSG